MANFLYVDNSNVWIEGMHVSAFVKGNAPSLWDRPSNSSRSSLSQIEVDDRLERTATWTRFEFHRLSQVG